MSQLLIQQYLNDLRMLEKVSGSQRESVVREAFKDLLKDWARSHDLVFVPEYEYETATKERRYVDGALLYSLRVPFGYWEAKDQKDDLDAEIEIKMRRGYPQDNIVFEDSREAVEQFKTDLPAILSALRDMIERAERDNATFRKAAEQFLAHAKDVINLKREFPRIPFYADFWQWADWGNALMDLHIGYESVEPYPLTRTDVPDEKAHKAGLAPKAMLKADKDAGTIRLDSETTLTGIPPEAWNYKLGNRCALEWILDQYKEKTPKDPTIREEFNTYRFADYKEKVVDLLLRVTTVSVATQKIVEAMKAVAR